MTDFLDVVNRMGLVVIPASGGHLLVEGDVDLSGSDIATLPDNLTIIGSLIARECARLSALPAGLDIMDSLDLRNTPITSLPADIGVGLDIMLENTGLLSLPANLAVDGALDLEGTPVAALPATLSVGGYLNLRNTAVTELPEDWCIDGPLLLDVEKISSPLAWRRVPLASLTPDDPILQDYFLPAEQDEAVSGALAVDAQGVEVFTVWVCGEIRVFAGRHVASAAGFDHPGVSALFQQAAHECVVALSARLNAGREGHL